MFVIVDMLTHTIVKRTNGRTQYPTERGATMSMYKADAESRWNDTSRIDNVPRFVVMSYDSFNKYLNPMVERVNIMSGKTFMEPRDTPYFCSPSSETYWSM